MKSIRALSAALALLLVAPLVIGQGADATPKPGALTPETKTKVLEEASKLITTSAYVPGVDFTKWNTYLATEKDKLDKAKTDDEFADAFQAAISKFGFSHLVLHTPRAVATRMSSSTVGIGVRINPTPDGILVVGLIEKAPAVEAGIEVGDLIIEANGVKVAGTSSVAGPEGTQVKIKVKRGDTTKEFNITRRKFSTVRPEDLTWVDKDTSVLKIYTFDISYDRDRVEDLIKQAGKGKRLIIDLRGNGGGAVINLMHLLGTLLPDNSVMGTFVDKSLVDQFVKEQKGSPTDLKAIADWSPRKMHIRANRHEAIFKGEVAVLVDGGSGSASEIAAAALRDTLSAPVVGTKSAGAVLVSMMRPLPGTDYVLQIPVDDYVTAKGIRLEGNGIVPDTTLAKMPPFLKKGEVDPAWDAAVVLMKKQESTVKSGN